MSFSIVVHFYQKSNLVLLEIQNVTLDVLMNKCYIKGAGIL